MAGCAASGAGEQGSDSALSPEARIKRTLWRAAHRGTKEMDIVLGRYAEAMVPAMSVDELTEFERLLALPDPDLNRWILDPSGIEDATLAPLFAAIRRFHSLAT